MAVGYFSRHGYAHSTIATTPRVWLNFENAKKNSCFIYFILEPTRGWLIVFIAGLIGPVLQFSGMQVSILGLFVPILGRAGRAFNPDLIVGMYCTHTFAMLYSYSVEGFFFNYWFNFFEF